MDFWQQYGIGAGLLALAVVFIFARSMRRPIKVELAVAEEQRRVDFEQSPRCICGEVARYPAPVLKRTRGAWDWLRIYFAAPPRYSREVDMMRAPVFCESHAHVADALMDRFIFDVRSQFSSLNTKIASDAAGFEQEALLKLVGESMTETQKRATRKQTAIVKVLPAPRTGTDDEGT